MLALAIKNAKVFIWALTLLAALEPLSASLCLCRCDFNAAYESGRSARAKKDRPRSTRCCGRKKATKSQDVLAKDDLASRASGSSDCPVHCPCHLHRETRSTFLVELGRQLVFSLAPTLSFPHFVILESTPPCAIDRTDQPLNISSAQCCERLCRFVI